MKMFFPMLPSWLSALLRAGLALGQALLGVLLAWATAEQAGTPPRWWQ